MCSESIEAAAGRVRETAVVESDLKRYGKPPGIWFPKSCTYISHLDGKLFQRDTVEVTEAIFNEPIPPDTFRLIGMNIPAGTRVSGSGVPKVGAYAWDGREIVRLKN